MRWVGADLGGTKLLLVAGDTDQPDRERGLERVPTGAAFDGAALEAALARFLDRLPFPAEAIGIAIPGLVAEGPVVQACDVLPKIVGWRPPASLTRGRFAMVNDAEAALREECHDVAAGVTAVVIMAGTGIGAGIVVDGRRFGGARGWAGELGSIPLVVDGRVRKLDEVASGEALVASLGADGARVRQRLDAGDPQAIAVVREAGERLGLALAGVIDLLNPHVVALGGGLTDLPGYVEAARATAERHTLPDLWRVCEVRRVRAGEQVAALGAARAARERA